MDVTADELAGVVDLFGGLTRRELERALAEAAFRVDGRTVEADALEEPIASALESFALVEYDPGEAASAPPPGGGAVGGGGSDPLYVAGPTAFPTVPEGAEDVPHILDVEKRRLDRGAVGESVRDRFAEAVASAVDAADEERCRRLLEVSYDLEAWAPVDCSDDRDRLEAVLE